MSVEAVTEWPMSVKAVVERADDGERELLGDREDVCDGDDRDEGFEVPHCWRDFADVLSAGVDRILLYGPPGTGKTYAALRWGVRGDRAERLTCTEESTSADVTGTWMPVGEGRWDFLEGPAIRAWRANAGNGGRLVLDEIDRAGGDLLSLLLTMTDGEGSARWFHPLERQSIEPGPRFSVVMTTNVERLAEIPAALRDRFPVALRIDRPHPTAARTLAPDLRGPALQGSLGPEGRRVSLRGFHAFDRLRRDLGADRAARLVVGADAAQDFLDALTISALGA